MAALTTETASDRYRAVETWPDQDILGAILDGQAAAIAAIRPALPAIATAADLLAKVWREGGRIAYAGAGSSGLMALVDALELPGTYGMAGERLPVLLAGGAATFSALDNESEDDVAAAEAGVIAAGLGAGDVIVAVSASGGTPYTLAAARVAAARGASVVAIACNARAALFDGADVAIAVPTGPELVAGSTRMNAGTAQKCVFNMLSTLTAMKLHHVHDGMMVNVRAENIKLRERAARIVARAAGVDETVARAALAASEGDVKSAVLVAAGVSLADARRRLDDTGGDLRAALASHSAFPNGRTGP